jgi:hypothetical protein
MEKSNALKFAEIELDILSKTVEDPIVRDFIPEILALVDRFGKSGQSGGSAPTVATVIANTFKKLCLFEPITPITGIDDE